MNCISRLKCVHLAKKGKSMFWFWMMPHLTCDVRWCMMCYRQKWTCCISLIETLLRDSVVMEREDSTDQIKHQNMQKYWNTKTQGNKTTAARNTQQKTVLIWIFGTSRAFMRFSDEGDWLLGILKWWNKSGRVDHGDNDDCVYVILAVWRMLIFVLQLIPV